VAGGLNLGELVIQLGVDDSKLNRVLARNTKKLQTFGNSFTGLAGNMAMGLAGITAAAGLITGLTVKVASDMQELNNVVDQTFGENSKNINNWAKSTASDMNRARKSFLDFAGTAGATLKAQGFDNTEY